MSALFFFNQMAVEKVEEGAEQEVIEVMKGGI